MENRNMEQAGNVQSTQEPQTPDWGDTVDNIDRRTRQLAALLNAAGGGDNPEELPAHTMENLLWLARDLITEIREHFKKLVRDFPAV
jgi:hypothetical protein